MYTTQKVHHQEHYGVRPLRPLILLCYAAARLKQFLLRDIKTCRTPTESYYRSFNALKPMEILVNNITITQCIRYSNDPLGLLQQNAPTFENVGHRGVHQSVDTLLDRQNNLPVFACPPLSCLSKPVQYLRSSFELKLRGRLLWISILLTELDTMSPLSKMLELGLKF